MSCYECARKKEKPRDPKETKALLSRLNRIEGQLRGIGQMIEDGRYCGDVLIQVAAARKALDKVASLLLSTHMKTCVRDQIIAGDEEVIDETLALFERLV